MKIKLSGRELDVMNVLWSVQKPMVASEICRANPSLSINTVQAVLKSLLKRNLIRIADIVYSGTVLTRSYETVLSASDYSISQFKDNLAVIDNDVSTIGLIAVLLEQEDNEEEVINELEELLKKRKQQLDGGD